MYKFLITLLLLPSILLAAPTPTPTPMTWATQCTLATTIDANCPLVSAGKYLYLFSSGSYTYSKKVIKIDKATCAETIQALDMPYDGLHASAFYNAVKNEIYFMPEISADDYIVTNTAYAAVLNSSGDIASWKYLGQFPYYDRYTNPYYGRYTAYDIQTRTLYALGGSQNTMGEIPFALIWVDRGDTLTVYGQQSYTSRWFDWGITKDTFQETWFRHAFGPFNWAPITQLKQLNDGNLMFLAQDPITPLDMVLWKADIDGNTIWSNSQNNYYNSSNSKFTEGADGNIYTFGTSSYTTAVGYSYDANGNSLFSWAIPTPGIPAYIGLFIQEISAHNTNEVWYCGNSDDNVAAYGYLSATDSIGTPIFETDFNDLQQVSNITPVASSSDVLVCGSFKGANTLPVVMRVDSSGNCVWAKTFGVPTTWNSGFTKIKYLDGDYYAAGSLDQKPYIVKMDDSGNVLATKHYACNGVTGSVSVIYDIDLIGNSITVLAVTNTNSSECGSSVYIGAYIAYLDSNLNILQEKISRTKWATDTGAWLHLDSSDSVVDSGTVTLPARLAQGSAMVYNNYLYTFAGINHSPTGTGWNVTSTVLSAPINPNGSLGTFGYQYTQDSSMMWAYQKGTPSLVGSTVFNYGVCPSIMCDWQGLFMYQMLPGGKIGSLFFDFANAYPVSQNYLPAATDGKMLYGTGGFTSGYEKTPVSNKILYGAVLPTPTPANIYVYTNQDLFLNNVVEVTAADGTLVIPNQWGMQIQPIAEVTVDYFPTFITRPAEACVSYNANNITITVYDFAGDVFDCSEMACRVNLTIYRNRNVFPWW